MLFESGLLRIGHVVAHGSTEPGELQRQDANVVVLPVRGIFTKHDAPRRQVTGTPSHAVFIAADLPYRLSFPGRIRMPCSPRKRSLRAASSGDSSLRVSTTRSRSRKGVSRFLLR